MRLHCAAAASDGAVRCPNARARPDRAWPCFVWLSVPAELARSLARSCVPLRAATYAATSPGCRSRSPSTRQPLCRPDRAVCYVSVHGLGAGCRCRAADRSCRATAAAALSHVSWMGGRYVGCCPIRCGARRCSLPRWAMRSSALLVTRCVARVGHLAPSPWRRGPLPRAHLVLTACSPRPHCVPTACSPRPNRVLTACSPRRKSRRSSILRSITAPTWCPCPSGGHTAVWPSPCRSLSSTSRSSCTISKMRTSSTYEPRRRPCLRVQYPIRHGKACMQRPCMVPPLLPRARPAVHAVTARSPPPPPTWPAPPSSVSLWSAARLVSNRAIGCAVTSVRRLIPRARLRAESPQALPLLRRLSSKPTPY